MTSILFPRYWRVSNSQISIFHISTFTNDLQYIHLNVFFQNKENLFYSSIYFFIMIKMLTVKSWDILCNSVYFQYVNYVNPICCVATLCHQVRCMYWGHWGHFHRAISHLKWYKIAYMIYLPCILCQMKSIDMFSMFFAIWSSQTFSLEIYCGYIIYNLTVFMFMHVNVDLKL